MTGEKVIPRPAYFEDLSEGDRFPYPSIKITQEMRDGHIALYGEDWPDEVVAVPKEKGIVPGPMLMSIVGGHWGKNNLLAIKVLKELRVRFYRPFVVGDVIVPETIVSEVRPHKDPEKNYGYIFIEQKLFNQKEELCCIRYVTFLVNRKEMRKG